jgi:hypothetical protein
MSNKLASEDVILSSPMSYSGSLRRIRRLGRRGPTWVRVLLTLLVVVPLVLIAWVVISAWYLVMYTIFFLPTVLWRFFRRGQRKNKAEQLRHREMLAAIQTGNPTDTITAETRHGLAKAPKLTKPEERPALPAAKETVAH